VRIIKSLSVSTQAFEFVICFFGMKGNLYLVATPIGNLKDISFRAIEVLKEVDLIACEDTRQTKKLLTHYGIRGKKLISVHDHNEQARAKQIAEILVQGKSIALVSDAGTPGICDPGYKIIKSAIESGAKVIPIPGAVAFVNAVIASGFPTDAIFFGGFLPSKKNQRRSRLLMVKSLPATLCFYESPHRLLKSLQDCFEILGDRRIAVVRELTKIYEEVISGNIQEVIAHFSNTTPRGEIVLVIDRESS